MIWEIPDVPTGFRKGRGIRDQVADICSLMEKVREFQENIYLCFTDYAEVFDCGSQQLWKFLKDMGIPDHLTCFLRNLYAGQDFDFKSDCIFPLRSKAILHMEY